MRNKCRDQIRKVGTGIWEELLKHFLCKSRERQILNELEQFLGATPLCQNLGLSELSKFEIMKTIDCLLDFVEGIHDQQHPCSCRKQSPTTICD